LDALALGAADYVMKPSKQSDLAMAMETLAGQLLPKIAVLGGAGFKMLSDVRAKTTQQVIAESKFSRVERLRELQRLEEPTAHW